MQFRTSCELNLALTASLDGLSDIMKNCWRGGWVGQLLVKHHPRLCALWALLLLAASAKTYQAYGASSAEWAGHALATRAPAQTNRLISRGYS